MAGQSRRDTTERDGICIGGSFAGCEIEEMMNSGNPDVNG